MNKNIIIAVLAVLCTILAALLVMNKDTPPTEAPIKDAKKEAVAPKALDTTKLPHEELIKTASLYGLTLDTPAEEIDSLVEKSPFTCRTSERETTSPDGEKAQEKFWICSHKNLKQAELRINVVDNQITTLKRSGPCDIKDIEDALIQVDKLKMKLSSLKDFSMDQSERSTRFRIRHKKGNGKITSLSYRLQTLLVRDPENKPEHDGMLSIAIIR